MIGSKNCGRYGLAQAVTYDILVATAQGACADADALCTTAQAQLRIQ